MTLKVINPPPRCEKLCLLLTGNNEGGHQMGLTLNDGRCQGKGPM